MQRIKPKDSRLSSVVAFSADISFGILISIVWLILTQHAYAIPETVPRDVLTLHPDGYVYADPPGCSMTLKERASLLRHGFI